MTILEIILLLAVFLLLFLLAASVYFNIKHGLIIIKLTESIEDTLDILDEKYDAMSKILEIPLFFDSPQIKSVVEDIKLCRDSLLKSANLLTNLNEDLDEKKENN